jgi:hypothetical protein
MAKVALDCDGVLADFMGSFLEILYKIYPSHPLTREKWNTWNYGGLVSKAEERAVWNRIRATENFWLGINAISNNVCALARWLITQRDQDVYLVTSRTPTAGLTVAKQTDWWIRSTGVEPVNNYLSIIPVARPEDKWKVYNTMGIGWSIDDKAETVEECDAYMDFGPVPGAHGTHRAYLLDQPWNQEAKVQRRVKSVEAFLREVV